jgi:ankyrin repeat protein
MHALYRQQPDIARDILARLPPERLTLHEAAATGQCGRLEELLAADPAAANAWSPDGFQPLALAAFFGQAEAVDVLLRRGAEVNTLARHAFGVNAVHAALASPPPDLARRLVEAGGDVNIPQRGSGTVALHTTAYNGDLDLTGWLLERGADASIADSQGRRPADVARERGHTEVADLLERAAAARA